MTTPTSMGNHGGTVTSCSPYAYPGFAEICILLRTWSTVTPGTCELAFLIKKKKKGPSEKRDQFAVLVHEGWADGHTPLSPLPKNRVQASSSGEHVV